MVNLAKLTPSLPDRSVVITANVTRSPYSVRIQCSAWVRGKEGGRKRVMDERKIALAARLMRDREVPISEVCEAAGVWRATLYRYLKPDGAPRAL